MKMSLIKVALGAQFSGPIGPDHDLLHFIAEMVAQRLQSRMAMTGTLRRILMAAFLLVNYNQPVAAHWQTDSTEDCAPLLAAQGMFADGFLSDLPGDLKNLINGLSRSWREMNEDFGVSETLAAGAVRAGFALEALADETRRVESAQVSLSERLRAISDVKGQPRAGEEKRHGQLKWVLAFLESYQLNLSVLRQKLYAIRQESPGVLH